MFCDCERKIKNLEYEIIQIKDALNQQGINYFISTHPDYKPTNFNAILYLLLKHLNLKVVDKPASKTLEKI